MTVISYLQKYFWGDNLQELDWKKNKDYISKTILERGDRKSVSWLFRKTDKKYLKQIIKDDRFDKKSKNFWSLYLS